MEVKTMKKVRTVFGLVERNGNNVDGYRHDEFDSRIRCWVDEDGVLYGGTPRLTSTNVYEANVSYNENGDVTVIRENKDYDAVRVAIEKHVGKTLTPVDVTGVLPYVTHTGLTSEQWENGKMSKELYSYGDTWRFDVLPMVIPKKYANKLDVKEANLEMMEETMKMETTDWSVI
tara:strand:- start:423 stop:944 length:522 start_codon:yes stop_codon:yes gene_type:complete